MSDDRYAIEMNIHDEGERIRYGVDLVRWSADADGLPRSQRLTLAQYPSQMEAEEHVEGASLMLDGMGTAGFQQEVDRLQKQPFDPVFYTVQVQQPERGAAALNLLAI
jgi:hypothetical protein